MNVHVLVISLHLKLSSSDSECKPLCENTVGIDRYSKEVKRFMANAIMYFPLVL